MEQTSNEKGKNLPAKVKQMHNTVIKQIELGDGIRAALRAAGYTETSINKRKKEILDSIGIDKVMAAVNHSIAVNNLSANIFDLKVLEDDSIPLHLRQKSSELIKKGANVFLRQQQTAPTIIYKPQTMIDKQLIVNKDKDKE
jgi:hypothetical protein